MGWFQPCAIKPQEVPSSIPARRFRGHLRAHWAGELGYIPAARNAKKWIILCVLSSVGIIELLFAPTQHGGSGA
jgi:hypothetical protein